MASIALVGCTRYGAYGGGRLPYTFSPVSNGELRGLKEPCPIGACSFPRQLQSEVGGRAGRGLDGCILKYFMFSS